MSPLLGVYVVGEVKETASSFRLKLRARDGDCGGAGTAIMHVVARKVNDIVLETPTDVGSIRTSATITRTSVPPITVPERVIDAG